MLKKKDLIDKLVAKAPEIEIPALIMKVTDNVIDVEIQQHFTNNNNQFRLDYSDILPKVSQIITILIPNVQDVALQKQNLSNWVIEAMMNYAIDSDLDITGNASTMSIYELRVSLHNVHYDFNFKEQNHENTKEII